MLARTSILLAASSLGGNKKYAVGGIGRSGN